MAADRRRKGDWIQISLNERQAFDQRNKALRNTGRAAAVTISAIKLDLRSLALRISAYIGLWMVLSPLSAFGAALSGDPQKMLEIVMTANTAIEFCGYGGKEKVDAIAEAYGVQPNKADVKVLKPIFEKLTDEVSDRRAFCDRAWSLYGEEGTEFSGILSRSKEMPSPLEDWIVEPAKVEGKFSHCLALRPSKRGSETIFATPESMAFVAIYSELKLEVGKTYKIVLDIGGESFDIDTDRITEGEESVIGFPIEGAIADQLRRSESFELNVVGKSFHVPFGQGAELIAKLQACVAQNESRP